VILSSQCHHRETRQRVPNSRMPIALAFSELIVVLYPVARITGNSGRIFNKSLAKSAPLRPGIV
jgi:hypothetical protein